jgi:hypothetical protein
LRKNGYDIAVANEGVNGDIIASMPTVRARLAELIRSLRARGIEVLYAHRRAPRASDGQVKKNE